MTHRALLLLIAGLVLAALPASASADPPSAAFSASPGSPVAGEEVVLRAEESKCGGGSTCVWSGDDGLAGGGRELRHVYAAAGTYVVRLIVTDPGDPAGGSDGGDEGGTDVREASIVVRPAVVAPPPPPPAQNRPPTASFRSSSSGLTVSFTGSVSDPEGERVSVAWRFGDGKRSAALSPQHTYARAGTYTVVLTARDRKGAESSATQRVTVAPGTTVSAESTPAATAVPPDIAPPAETAPAPPPETAPGPAASPPAGPRATPAPLVPGLRLMSPFPVVRVAGSVVGRSTRLTVISVRGPRSARVVVRCFGRACPFERRRFASTRDLSREKRLRGRLLRPGTVLDIRVYQPGRIGKRTKLRFRSRRAPSRTDGCVDPKGAVRPCR